MSINIEDMVGKATSCYTSHQDTFVGSLVGVDGSFNVVLSDCAFVLSEETTSTLSCVNNTQSKLARKTFVRGDDVVFIGFDPVIAMIPGVMRYERMPTRLKVQMFWVGLVITGFVYELIKMTVLRVEPRREEHFYLRLQEMYGEDNIPEYMIKQMQRQREAVETLTLYNTINSPTPGETSRALQNELDPRQLKNGRSWNGN